MTRTSERQSLAREEKFVALVHLYAELRLPFAAALDAAEADLLHEQNEGPKEPHGGSEILYGEIRRRASAKPIS